MKNFITSMLGALVALLIFTFCGLVLFIGILGAIVAMGARKNAPAQNLEIGSYLVFDLSNNLLDAPPPFDFSILSPDRPEPLQLRTVTRALRAAAADRRIAGILLKGSFKPAGLGSGYAALREVRGALEDFRRSGKPVRAYLETADTRDYYLASAASEITINPYGMIEMPGLASVPMFMAGGFEKFGIGIQVTRVGKYKAFVEPFTRKNMSPEYREETQRLLDDVWATLLADIGRSRKLAPAAIQATVDSQGLLQADAAVKAGLADKSAYLDQVIDALKAETGRGNAKGSFRQISLADYGRTLPHAPAGISHSELAIVYAEGDIVDGEGGPEEVGGTAFARKLRELRQDDRVKAVVLRINSPGGSVTASETIERELRLMRAAKPVVVSMGSYAASGGYWIAADADRIFAEPTTITGSIGVFGIQFDVQRLLSDYLGFTFDRVKTGKFADADTITRPKTPEELAVVQRLVDWSYSQFVAKVAEGRKLTREQVEAIAQGRVWSGAEARQLGLVDAMGGLDAAVRYAVKKAALPGEFRIVEYPAKQTLAEELAKMFGKMIPESAHAGANGLVGQVERRLAGEVAELKSYNDPQGVYARLPLDLSFP